MAELAAVKSRRTPDSYISPKALLGGEGLWSGWPKGADFWRGFKPHPIIANAPKNAPKFGFNDFPRLKSQRQKTQEMAVLHGFFSGAVGEIRTPDPRNRNPAHRQIFQ